MIYVEDTVLLQPSKMGAYEEHARELATILGAVGIKCIGTWTASSGNMAERTSLWACEDIMKFQTAIAKAVQSNEGAAWIQKTQGMQVSHTRRYLRPTPSSPLQ